MLSRLSSILQNLPNTLFSHLPTSASPSFLSKLKPHEDALRTIVSSYYFAQLFPFFVLFGLPALALAGYSFGPGAVRRLGEMLASAMSYLWGGVGVGGANTNADSATGTSTASEGKRRRRRAKADLVGNGVASCHSGETTTVDEDEDLELCYPGLVNVSGTYCFLNSVLQAMASLAYLQPHIDAIHARAVDLDVPTPVVDTLIDTLKSLNTPKPRPSSFRPVPMINALSQPSGSTSHGRSRLFSSREHQDAQELFQLLSECLKNEALAVDAEAQRDRGLGAFASFAAASSSSSSFSSEGSGSSVDGNDDDELGNAGVFDGLTANRRSCMTCGYTEAVMHFACATWQLALPTGSVGGGGEVPLESCLEDYTRLEVLTDCLCRRCSLRATQARLMKEVEDMLNASKEEGSVRKHHGNGTAVGAGGHSKKKRKGREKEKAPPIDTVTKVREVEEQERMVAKAIAEGRIEQDLPGITMERVFSRASTKQAMVARPPKVLVLHLNRSVSYGHHSVRNSAHVRFPEILDLTPYTTSGILSTAPQTPISPPPPAIPPRCATPTQNIYTVPRVLYRLSAVVAHYGAHSYGHYVCFRRRPRVVAAAAAADDNDDGEVEGMAHPAMPVLACPAGCDCTQCNAYGPIRDAFTLIPTPPSSSTLNKPKYNRRKTLVRAPLRGHNAWLRISDDRVEECALERVLAEGAGAFLLFYERVQAGDPLLLHHRNSLNTSTMANGNSNSIGVGFVGRATLGKVYVNGGYARGTPRSSEETVRPDEVGASVDSFALRGNGGVSGSESGSRIWANGDANPRTMQKGSNSMSMSMSMPISVPRANPSTVPAPTVSISRPRVVRRTTAGRRRRTVVPSAAVAAAFAIGSESASGFGQSSALEIASASGNGNGSEGGGGGLEMATSVPDLREISAVDVGAAGERMVRSEMVEEGGEGEGQTRFRSMAGVGSVPSEGMTMGRESPAESMVRVERSGAGASAEDSSQSQSFREDSLDSHISSSPRSTSLPTRNAHSLPPSISPSSNSPRPSSPSSSISTSSSSSSSSSSTGSSKLRSNSRTPHHSRGTGPGTGPRQAHAHNAAAPLGLRA